jgi:heme o synthase
LISKESNSIASPSLALIARDYVALGKFRLASLVVFSAVIGYFIAPGPYAFSEVLFLISGGFLVTASSNAFNQVWERHLDIKMDRTKDRPVAAGRLSVLEGLIFAVITGLVGELCLFYLNPLSGLLGLLALLLYVLIYTPLKTISPIAVFVGAFPGSIPPLLGYVAATGSFGLEPGMLFLVQFFWQFPHFWSIAWKIHEDYIKAGFYLLPSRGGRNRMSAFHIFVYSAAMIPVGILPWVFEMTNDVSMIFAILFGIALTIPAYKLYKTLEMKYAKQLMFYSFAYLPLIQLLYLFTKN